MMITIGSISRAALAEVFPFHAERFPGRRAGIKELTRGQPDFVFWIFPSTAADLEDRDRGVKSFAQLMVAVGDGRA